MEMPPSVKSADRVLDLFELLASSGRSMSHTEIVDTLGIPKSSLSQLLRNLVARGYVESNGRVHCLGPAFQRIAARASVTRRLPEIVGPILDMLTKETGESSAFNQLAGDETEVIATVLGPHRLVTHMRLGDTAPLYATSGGKAILAAMPPSFADSYLNEVKFNAATPKTIGSTAALQTQLDESRRSGFAYSFEEWTPGIVGVAVAVIGNSDTPLGALSVAVPAQRADKNRLEIFEKALRRACDEFIQRLASRT